MAGSTPPKGRPTPGRRDRAVAQHRSRSRTRIIKFAWAIAALSVLAAVLVLGSGTGGDGVTTNVALPLVAAGPVLTRRRAMLSGERS